MSYSLTLTGSPANRDRIAEMLRERGFDARSLADVDEATEAPCSGVAIHGVCVLGWRYPDGRWEFTERPARLMEPEHCDPTGRWIWDDVLAAGGQPFRLAATVSDPSHTVAAAVTELLPADPNRPRVQCLPDLWAWQEARRALDDAPDGWKRSWRDYLPAELDGPGPGDHTGGPRERQTRVPLPRDPTQLLSTPADALHVAEKIVRGTTPATACAALWAAASQVPLAALLYAGSARGNGKGVGWVVEAAGRPDADIDTPGWASGVRYLGECAVLQSALRGVLTMDPRQRDSVAITMRAALAPWSPERLEQPW